VPAHLDNFTYGWPTAGLAYALSFLGCLLGLVSTVRARAMPTNRSRGWWLVLAAWAIGGTGIWVMHFTAMIGFTVSDAPIHYDVTITVLSWLAAVVSVGIGLFIVGYGKPSEIKVLAAGLFTGLGVAGMHYAGMSAMRLPANVHYDRNLVIISIVIAIVAATVALWFTVTLRRVYALIIAAVIMAIAVCGMHYTGMFAVRATLTETGYPAGGLTPFAFLVPIVLFVCVVGLTLVIAMFKWSWAGEPMSEPPAPPPPPIKQPPTSIADALRSRTS
jgi:NO-binding membrane sensor protein with MHYT domain